MFDSGIKALELIDEIKNEADISVPVSDSSYISWLNSLEQLLYRELIQEQGKIELEGVNGPYIGIDALEVPNGENAVRYEDIHTIYVDKIQLIKSTVASGDIFPDNYYKIGNNIGLNLQKEPKKIKIIYFVRPELKTKDNIEEKNVMLPVEFIDLARAKLRGEVYKVANEDNISAKWINDYNILLETFKAWLLEKKSEFGM